VCCNVSQCVAVCRSVLQCVAVCCSVLQCVAVCLRHTPRCPVAVCLWLGWSVPLNLTHSLPHSRTPSIPHSLISPTDSLSHILTLLLTLGGCQHVAYYAKRSMVYKKESLNQHETSCSVLQCVAVCCSVLQCVAVCCSVLQCVAVCCSVLQCESPSR